MGWSYTYIYIILYNDNNDDNDHHDNNDTNDTNDNKSPACTIMKRCSYI